MKLIDIIDSLDKSPENEECMRYNLDNIGEDLGIDGSYYISQKENNVRLRCYWVSYHLCTDTWVGIRAYFYDDTFVAISYQPARKSDEKFEWVSLNLAKAVRKYILSLQEEDELNISILDTIDEELGDGYTVNYAGQVLYKKVLYKNTLCEVVRNNARSYGRDNIALLCQGEVIDVDVEDLVCPWNIK